MHMKLQISSEILVLYFLNSKDPAKDKNSNLLKESLYKLFTNDLFAGLCNEMSINGKKVTIVPKNGRGWQTSNLKEPVLLFHLDKAFINNSILSEMIWSIYSYLGLFQFGTVNVLNSMPKISLSDIREKETFILAEANLYKINLQKYTRYCKSLGIELEESALCQYIYENTLNQIKNICKIFVLYTSEKFLGVANDDRVELVSLDVPKSDIRHHTRLYKIG